MSAMQLKRTMGVSYKTAWYMCHRIREAMKTDHEPMLGGTVEVDETYIGGRKKGVGTGNARPMKPMVLAAIERGGKIRIRKGGKRATRKELHAFIHENVKTTAERIVTDQHSSYLGIADADTVHETVNHGRGEYVRGDIHTNTVESAFSLFKRAIVGSFHQISSKHLDRYLDEFEFRFNNRGNKFLFRDTVKRLIDGKAMPYEKLTA
jgi:transposase-like protein